MLLHLMRLAVSFTRADIDSVRSAVDPSSSRTNVLKPLHSRIVGSDNDVAQEASGLTVMYDSKPASQ
jgi:hypothetical protein